MLDQTFSTKNLRSLLSKNDFIKHDLVKKDEEYVSRIENISESINNGIFFDHQFVAKTIKNKIAYDACSLHNTLILRKVNQNIKKLYNVYQNERLSCIKRIATVLEDTVPIYITKLDIKDFYETISRGEILKKLLTDHLLSHQSKQILRDLFSRPEFDTTSGLPRGLSISSSMSEIFMRSLDKHISSMEGVYFYSRYVDDLIIFSIVDSTNIFNEVKKHLSSKLDMSLNEGKSQRTKINCDCKKLCKCDDPKNCKLLCECSKDANGIYFDYLGYNFKVEPKKDRKIPGKPIISISESKIKKYKSRMCLALIDFAKTGDFNLLENRIKFLSGNFYVDPSDKKKNLRAGIYYNYQLITNFNVLNELDTFLRKAIFSSKGSLGKKLQPKMTSWQRKRLAKYSFYYGFKSRIFHVFTKEDLSAIKECWR